jgi:hypothetical protein
MRAWTALRIAREIATRGGLRPRYWALARFLAPAARLARLENRHFRRVVIRDQLRFFSDGIEPIEGETERRARAAADWLLRAQDATSDDGVSLGYFPCGSDEPADGLATTIQKRGWRPSYPEATGYVIESLLDFADLHRDEEVRKRALRMAHWEVDVQMPSGAVQSGPVVPPERQVASVFNTGMVLQGFTAILQRERDERILSAASRAADFLIRDQGADGHFRSQGNFVTGGPIKTYNCLSAWALYRFGELTNREVCKAAAVSAVEASVREQAENGWFRNNDLTRPDVPLLHTIAYALQGILEVGVLTGRSSWIEAARRGTDPVLDRMEESGFLHGRYRSNWEPAAYSSCLTGSAQVAVVCYRLAEITGDQRYAHSGDRILNFLKALQILDSEDPGVSGAIPGSFPIFGHYMTAGYPNWATKYFLDGLLLQEQRRTS